MASKRIQDDQGSSKNRPAKRSKASQACATCRKHKTRCELLDTNCTTGPIQCHRCKVLNIECSFENSDIIILPKNSAAPPGALPGVEYGAGSSEDRTSEPSSSSPQGESPAASDVANRMLKVEDFVPTPRTPWGSLSLPDGFDWGAAPVTAVHGLATPATKFHRSTPYNEATLANILNPSQIANCLEIFETRYRPWMNLPMSKENSTALDLARCCIASRHLDAQTRARAAPRLQALVEKTILQPGYMSPSLEFVEALLILALWEPLHGDGYIIPRDGRLLAMSAVETALTLGLDRHNIMTLRRENMEQLDPSSEEVKSARMWATSANIEQLLLLGSGKAPRSKRPHPDNLEDFISVYSTDDSRDLRLVLKRRLFDITHRGMALSMDNPSELDKWYKDTTEVLSSLGWIHRLISPLPVVSQFDSFYFNLLEVQYNICRLLVLHNTLLTMRKVFDQSTQRMWFQVQLNGLYIAHGWTGDALYTAEAALIAILSRPDIVSLSTAPDQYFLLITFACTFLIVARFAIYHIREGPVHGQTEHLLNRIAERFQQAALSPDHLPNRCAEAIKELVASWERRGPRMITRYKEGAMHPESISSSSSDCPPTPHTTQPTPIPPSYSQGAAHPPAPIPPSIVPSSSLASLTDPELFFDSQFWSSFITNLNS